MDASLLICTKCGARMRDIGDPDKYSCSMCHKGPLIRVHPIQPKPMSTRLVIGVVMVMVAMVIWMLATWPSPKH